MALATLALTVSSRREVVPNPCPFTVERESARESNLRAGWQCLGSAGPGARIPALGAVIDCQGVDWSGTWYAPGSSSVTSTLRGPSGVGTIALQLG